MPSGRCRRRSGQRHAHSHAPAGVGGSRPGRRVGAVPGLHDSGRTDAKSTNRRAAPRTSSFTTHLVELAARRPVPRARSPAGGRRPPVDSVPRPISRPTSSSHDGGPGRRDSASGQRCSPARGPGQVDLEQDRPPGGQAPAPPARGGCRSGACRRGSPPTPAARPRRSCGRTRPAVDEVVVARRRPRPGAASRVVAETLKHSSGGIRRSSATHAALADAGRPGQHDAGRPTGPASRREVRVTGSLAGELGRAAPCAAGHRDRAGGGSGRSPGAP